MPPEAQPQDSQPQLGTEPPATPNEQTVADAVQPPAPEAPKEEAPKASLVSQQPAPAPEPLTAEQITIPEGITVSDEQMQSFLTLMNDSEMTPADRASKMLDMHRGLLESASASLNEVWEQTQADWRTQAQALPDIGGVRLEQTLADVAKLVDRYGDAEVRTAFDITGAGNHPAMIRFLHKIGKELNEAPPVSGSPSAASMSRPERMYGTKEK